MSKVNKFHIIVEVSHERIEANAISKELADEIVQILYISPTKEAAIVQFAEILRDYPPEKYQIVFRCPTCVNIFDIGKINGWVKSYRPNKLVKTISIRETPDKLPGPTTPQ